MYNDGQVLGAATTTSVAVVALPLTSGNSIFQSIIFATAIVALTILIVRIVKLTIAKRSA
jgi:hypothetical protein